MQGEDRSAVVVRKPGDRFHIRIRPIPPKSLPQRIPFLRGVFIFMNALISGMKTLMYSAEILEEAESAAEEGGEDYKKDKMTIWLEKHFGEKGAFNVMLAFSLILAIIFTVGIFIVSPTLVVNLLSGLVKSDVGLNIIEGFFRILLFVIYVALISRMKDIRNVFQYHGAEHKCIHCYENNLPLTPENCQKFETLHPRCGTSFLMFVLVISLLLFSLLGWPNLGWRIASRILLLPVIAGISYELLRWAGSSNTIVVKILSLPGLALQKLTTMEPERKHLEVAIAAMKAVLSTDGPKRFEGETDMEGNLYAIPKQQRKGSKKQQKLKEQKIEDEENTRKEAREWGLHIPEEKKLRDIEWVSHIEKMEPENEKPNWGFGETDPMPENQAEKKSWDEKKAPWEKDEVGRNPWATDGYDPFAKKQDEPSSLEDSPWDGYDLFANREEENSLETDENQIKWDFTGVKE